MQMQANQKKPVQFSENDRLPDIRHDIVFKAVFTRDTPASRGALSSLVSTLIGREISVQTITANEPAADNTRDRGIRFDIACKTNSGELVNVEMSLYPSIGELIRLEYYEARLFCRQDIAGSGKSFSDLKESFQITILGHKRFFNDESLVHIFEYYDRTHDVSLGGKTRIITMELCKAWQGMEKPVKEMGAEEAWAAFFEYLTSEEKRGKINAILKKEEGIAMAGETLITITDEEREWVLREAKFKQELDYQSDMTYARQEGMRETARNFKLGGASLDLIAKSTGLTPEEIAGL